MVLRAALQNNEKKSRQEDLSDAIYILITIYILLAPCISGDYILIRFDRFKESLKMMQTQHTHNVSDH